MKGRWESNINIWFRFMYSQKWNCGASLFPKQNYNVLSPNFHIHVPVSDLFVPRICLSILLQPNRQTDSGKCRNWEWGRAVLFLGIHKSDFRNSLLVKEGLKHPSLCLIGGGLNKNISRESATFYAIVFIGSFLASSCQPTVAFRPFPLLRQMGDLCILHVRVQKDLNWARICKLFKELRNRFPAWRAGTSQPYLTYRHARLNIGWRNRFLGSLNVYKYGLWCRKRRTNKYIVCVAARDLSVVLQTVCIPAVSTVPAAQ